MPRYCANLTWLYQDLPLLERFAAAKEDDFEGVEILFPYDESAQDIRNQLVRHELSLVLINCPPPNYTGGPQGYAADPENIGRFQHDFTRVLRYASVLSPEFIHIMSGPGEGDLAKSTMIENLKWAAATAPKQKLTIEVINQDDLPNYFLSDFTLAQDILQTVNAPNLSLQFDTWHARKITGQIEETWEEFSDLATHIQVGGWPDRAEPNEQISFLNSLKKQGYNGWVAGEYRPAGDTSKGLGWRV